MGVDNPDVNRQNVRNIMPINYDILMFNSATLYDGATDKGSRIK
jgi:hypothetical protein